MIYFMLHGFASSTPNETSKFYEDYVLADGDRLFNLNYPFNKDAAKVLIKAVENILEKLAMTEYFKTPNMDDITFVGCSLGGYMAQHMAGIYMGKAICVNPAVIPYEDLSRFLGVNTNYRTAETFNMTEEDVASFKAFHIRPGRVPTLVLLDMGDDVLDSNKTIQHFLDKAEIRTFAGGSHRFDHNVEALPFIIKFANTLL